MISITIRNEDPRNAEIQRLLHSVDRDVLSKKIESQARIAQEIVRIRATILEGGNVHMPKENSL